MKINIQKEQTFKQQLPAPPFVIRLSSKDDWHKLLNDYPELEENWRWTSSDRLSERNYTRLCRYFYTDGGVTASERNDEPDWPLMEYP